MTKIYTNKTLKPTTSSAVTAKPFGTVGSYFAGPGDTTAQWLVTPASAWRLQLIRCAPWAIMPRGFSPANRRTNNGTQCGASDSECPPRNFYSQLVKEQGSNWKWVTVKILQHSVLDCNGGFQICTEVVQDQGEHGIFSHLYLSAKGQKVLNKKTYRFPQTLYDWKCCHLQPQCQFSTKKNMQWSQNPTFPSQQSGYLCQFFQPPPKTQGTMISRLSSSVSSAAVIGKVVDQCNWTFSGKQMKTGFSWKTLWPLYTTSSDPPKNFREKKWKLLDRSTKICWWAGCFLDGLMVWWYLLEWIGGVYVFWQIWYVVFFPSFFGTVPVRLFLRSPLCS